MGTKLSSSRHSVKLFLPESESPWVSCAIVIRGTKAPSASVSITRLASSSSLLMPATFTFRVCCSCNGDCSDASLDMISNWLSKPSTGSETNISEPFSWVAAPFWSISGICQRGVRHKGDLPCGDLWFAECDHHLRGRTMIRRFSSVWHLSERQPELRWSRCSNA